MSRGALAVALAFCAFGCLPRYAVHPRALEANELCAIAIGRGQLEEAEGIIALKQGKRDEALGAFLKAIEFDPAYASAWLHLGVLYAEAGQLRLARDAFVACIDAAPDDLQCRGNLVQVNRSLPLEPQ